MKTRLTKKNVRVKRGTMDPGKQELEGVEKKKEGGNILKKKKRLGGGGNFKRPREPLAYKAKHKKKKP